MHNILISTGEQRTRTSKKINQLSDISLNKKHAVEKNSHHLIHLTAPHLRVLQNDPGHLQIPPDRHIRQLSLNNVVNE
jgi:hypothetical protein